MRQVKSGRVFWIVLIFSALCFSILPPVFAQTWNVILEDSNKLPDGQQFGAVSLSYIYDDDKRGVKITMTAHEDILFPGRDCGIQNFSFNTSIINPEATLMITLPESWTSQYGPFKLSEFGRFHITAVAEGSNRVNPLLIEIYHVSDNLTYTDFTIENRDNRLFAAHITASHYTSSDELSAYCATGKNPTISGGTTTTITRRRTVPISPPTTTSSMVTTTSTSVVTTTTSSMVTTTSTSQPTTTSSMVTTITTSQPTTTSSVLTTTSTSQPTTTTSTGGPCSGEIARGRECPGEAIDDPAYNQPGRRGLAATCGDIVDFAVCSNCEPFDPACLEWTITPEEPFLSLVQIDDCCWRLLIGDACDLLEEISQVEVTVTDTCNGWSDSVIVEVGKVIIDVDNTTVPQVGESFEVAVKLINPDHYVRAISTDICECDGDSLECTGCVIDPARALDFICVATEQADGCCKAVLYAVDPSAMIWHGSGPVFNLLYSRTGEVGDGECVCLRSINRQVSDQFNEQLCTCQSTGEVCFKSCGDIYPQDCIGGDCGGADCGDGVVDLFDVLEGIDIILGLQVGTACQLDRANVPNGMPPYCGDPAGHPNCYRDGDLDMLDVLVMMDIVHGKINCCEYCLFKDLF